MCLYQFRFMKQIEEFYCEKFKEVLSLCPSSCSYYVNHVEGRIREYYEKLKCLYLDFISVKTNRVAVCLIDAALHPNCVDCPPKKKKF